MSLDAEPSPSSSSRDWLFPSQSFAHSFDNYTSKTPKYPRRFSSNPRLSQPLPPDSKPHKTPAFQSVSSSNSSSFSEYKYAGLRRRSYLSRRAETSPKREENGTVLQRNAVVSNRNVGVSEEKTSESKMIAGFYGQRVKFRWHMVISLVIMITFFTSLVHKNFSLHNQVDELQNQVSKLNGRLRACNLLDSTDVIRSISKDSEQLSSEDLKNLALIVSLTLLSIPVVILKYIDYVSKSRSPDNISEEVSLSKQLAYRVDVFFSVHPYAKPLALLVATLLLICLGGLALFGVTDDNLADCLWLSWTFVADSGNHANSEGIGPRLVSVSISFGGMLIFAMMLGLVSDSISEKFDSLRKGRSEVVEQNHTLILGWSDKLGSLLNQLAIANESLGGGIVVVMAERDKEEMELDISKMEFDFKGTSVICRSGSPLILADLKKVSVSKAHAIIVLAEDGNADQSDARALRTVLSLTGVKEGLRGHIVVELSDLDNEVLVKLVGGDLVQTVVAHDVIGRLMIQCARQPGLAQVRRGNLPKDFILPKSAEKILFCGWRRDMEDMIMVLDAFLAPGSELWMFNDVPENDREKKLIDGGLDLSRLMNISLVNREGNAVIRRHLESLPLESFDSILILADESVEDSAIQADSRSLATLLLIRDIQAKRLPYREARVSQVHRGSFSQGSWIGEMQQASDKSVIISEILDPRTKNLLSMSKISDYVLSNELVSMALAMVAEDRQINDVLEELFAEEGNELHIRQADLYLRKGEELSFLEVILRARQRREIVIGYRSANAERAVINPPLKSEKRRWSLQDVFVVIAEKE
ncbi:putative ion channel CASTOR [Citrus sinensis]|uniref:ion channel CASTOR-like isoform X3 n=1 Tax=Citrus sinensis TaxID=2711 RepID=UPI00218EC2F1|nr:ion channel CASTOR-like isoform X3 [Citrus sinensis]KAH9726871.1 putative ion channel CASTOR [Citrus sinensis]